MYCDSVYLAQSDTTAGFLCKDFKKLNRIKGRNEKQSVIVTLSSLEKLKKIVRVPRLHRKRIRQSHKSTFIYRGKNALVPQSLGVRVVKDSYHSEFLDFFPYLYSTSANPHKKPFDLEFALKRAEVLVLDKRELSQKPASFVFRVVNSNLRRVR